jgi:hypothetical protein
MSNVCIKKWQTYKINKLFDHKKGKTLSAENKDIYQGDIPCINGSAYNNGILTFLDESIVNIGFKIQKAPCLSISRVGNSGLAFLQESDFFIADNAYSLTLKKQYLDKGNKYVYLFLRTVLNQEVYKYSYGRIINSKYFNTEIILPTKNNEPDWEYMESYIKELEKKIEFKPIKTKKSQKLLIDMSDWKEFSFIDKKLWTKITHGKRLIESDRINGEIPYYSASEYNNSMTDSINNPLFTEQNCIVYSTFGTAFWAEGEFTASDEVYAFYNSKLNKYNALFITTIMRQNQYKFKFGRKAFSNKFENEIIMLPVDKNNEPDWQYMENYIKSLPYAEYL